MRALLLLALAAAVASAHTITWTGIAEDNQWFNHINWSPAQVPTQNDDVIINQGMVLVAAAASCNSLTMGMLVGQTANITIFNAFAVGQGGMSINVNGNVIINSGPQQVFASATIQGSLNFIDGILAGQWTIAKGGSANLGNANEKGFVGCAFKNEGSMSLGGVIVLNQSSVFTFAAPITVTTDLILQNGDGSQVSFDASTTSFTYAGGTLTVQATFLLGQFTLQSGDIMILAPLTFASTLNTPKLSRISAFGAAILNMTGATGAGMIVAGCNSATFGNLQLSGEVNIIGGDVIFSGQSDMGILTLKGGNAVFMNNVYPAQLNVLSGTSAGSGSVIAAKVLVQTTGFTLNSRFVANGTATFEATTLPFGQYGAFEIAAGATGSAQGALLLTGPPFIPGFTNAGSFVANSAVSSQNINIQGAGTFQVVSKLTIGSATFSQSTVSLNSGAVFSGSNSFLTIKVVSSVSGGNVMAKLGDYNLVCKGECDNISTPNSAAPTSDFSFSA